MKEAEIKCDTCQVQAMWPTHSKNLSGFKVTFTKLCLISSLKWGYVFSSKQFYSNN